MSWCHYTDVIAPSPPTDTEDDPPSQLQLVSTPNKSSVDQQEPSESPVPDVRALDTLVNTASPGETPRFKEWMRPIEAYYLGMSEDKKACHG